MKSGSVWISGSFVCMNEIGCFLFSTRGSRRFAWNIFDKQGSRPNIVRIMSSPKTKSVDQRKCRAGLRVAELRLADLVGKSSPNCNIRNHSPAGRRLNAVFCTMTEINIDEKEIPRSYAPRDLFSVVLAACYSASRISSILIAAVAIGVPGPKMAAAPSL